MRRARIRFPHGAERRIKLWKEFPVKLHSFPDLMSENRELAMKVLLLAVVAAAFCGVPPVHAQRQPPYDMWCRDQRIGPGPFDTVMICQAYTYE